MTVEEMAKVFASKNTHVDSPEQMEAIYMAIAKEIKEEDAKVASEWLTNNAHYFVSGRGSFDTALAQDFIEKAVKKL